MRSVTYHCPYCHTEVSNEFELCSKGCLAAYDETILGITDKET